MIRDQQVLSRERKKCLPRVQRQMVASWAATTGRALVFGLITGVPAIARRMLSVGHRHSALAQRSENVWGFRSDSLSVRPNEGRPPFAKSAPNYPTCERFMRRIMCHSGVPWSVCTFH